MVNFSILRFVCCPMPQCCFAFPGAINFLIPSFFFYEIKCFRYFIYLGYPNFESRSIAQHTYASD